MLKNFFFSFLIRNPWFLEWMIWFFGGEKILAPYFLSRSLTIGISYADSIQVFSRIHSMEDWVKEWYRLGFYWEKLSKKAQSENFLQSYTQLCLQSRAAYHMAQFPFFGNAALKEKIYEKCRQMYENAVPYFKPSARKIEIPWQDTSMPGYFRSHSDHFQNVIVVVGGIDGVKEEMHYYSDFFITRGYSVLYFDPPGIGECWKRSRMIPDFASVGQAVYDFLKSGLLGSVNQVILLGFSLGGNITLHMAAARPFQGCISICDPFEPIDYFDRLSYLVREASAHVVGDGRKLRPFLNAIGLSDVCQRVVCPVLIIGAGKDTILPPDESKRTFEALRQKKKMIFYEDATHCCPEHAFEMMLEIERWLSQLS